MAHMGHPSAPYLSLSIRLSHPIDSESPLVSPRRRSYCWALPSLAWEGGGPLACGCAFFPRPVCGSGGPCLGHVPSNQTSSHRAGHIPSVTTPPIKFPSALNRGRERVFCPNPSPFSNCCISSLNRGRERFLVLFLHLFLSCRLSSLFLLTECVRASWRFLSERG